MLSQEKVFNETEIFHFTSLRFKNKSIRQMFRHELKTRRAKTKMTREIRQFVVWMREQHSRDADNLSRLSLAKIVHYTCAQSTLIRRLSWTTHTQRIRHFFYARDEWNESDRESVWERERAKEEEKTSIKSNFKPSRLTIQFHDYSSSTEPK